MKKLATVAAVTAMAACTRHVQTRVTTPANPAVAHAVQASMSRQIQNALDAGDGDLVANRLRERMMKEPGNTSLRMELAAYYGERGQPDLALEHYRLVLEREPDNERAVVGLARTLKDSRHLAEAAAALSRFVESHPRCGAEVPGWLGLIEDEAGEAAKAESAHRLGISLDPKSARLRNNLGYNLLSQGKRDQALEEFRAALQMDPRLEIARNNLALALSRNGSARERGEALLHWQSMSGPAAAHNNLAVVLMEQGDYATARRELETALNQHRGYVPAMRNLAILSEMDGRPAVLPAAPDAPKQANRGPVRRLLDKLTGSKAAAETAKPAAVARSSAKIKKGERTAP